MPVDGGAFGSTPWMSRSGATDARARQQRGQRQARRRLRRGATGGGGGRRRRDFLGHRHLRRLLGEALLERRVLLLDALHQPLRGS